jgi:hypothetical protein
MRAVQRTGGVGYAYERLGGLKTGAPGDERATRENAGPWKCFKLDRSDGECMSEGNQKLIYTF